MPIIILARLTFLEAVRRKIALAAFLLGLAFLVLYGVGLYYIRATIPGGGPADNLIREQIFSFLLMAGLYAVNFLSIAMGALLAADTLAGEIGSGVIQTVAARPIRRAEIVLGKWLGFAALLAAYLLFMVGGTMGLIYAQTGYVAPQVPLGLSILYLECLLVMSVTLALSSRISTLATGGAIFGLYGLAFIGGWVEQIGAIFRNPTAVNIGVISSLLLPSEALLRRASFVMTPPLAQTLGLGGGPLVVVSVPSPLMVAYGVVYLLLALGIAIRQFGGRDL